MRDIDRYLTDEVVEKAAKASREVLDLAYRYPGNAHSWAYLAKTLDKLV